MSAFNDYLALLSACTAGHSGTRLCITCGCHSISRQHCLTVSKGQITLQQCWAFPMLILTDDASERKMHTHRSHVVIDLLLGKQDGYP